MEANPLCKRVSDPQTDVAPGSTRGRNVRSKNQCSMCPAIHTKSRSWLRSSSTREPSDPLLRVVIFVCFSGFLPQRQYCVRLSSPPLGGEDRRRICFCVPHTSSAARAERSLRSSVQGTRELSRRGNPYEVPLIKPGTTTKVEVPPSHRQHAAGAQAPHRLPECVREVSRHTDRETRGCERSRDREPRFLSEFHSPTTRVVARR